MEAYHLAAPDREGTVVGSLGAWYYRRGSWTYSAERTTVYSIQKFRQIRCIAAADYKCDSMIKIDDVADHDVTSCIHLSPLADRFKYT